MGLTGMWVTFPELSTSTMDTLAEPRLATSTSRESGVNTTVRGSWPTGTSRRTSSESVATRVIVSLSGLTAATMDPSGETATADEETGPVKD